MGIINKISNTAIAIKIGFIRYTYKTYFHIKKFLLRLRFTYLIIVIMISLVLALPNIFINHDYMPSITDSRFVSKNSTIKISINNSNLVSASIIERLAQLVGQDFMSAPISICLDNKSRPVPSGLQLLSNTSTQELGAMLIRVKNLDSLTSDEVYAQVGNNTCKTFINGRIEIGNDIEFNNLFFSHNENGQTTKGAYIDFGDTKVKVRVIFNWSDLVSHTIIIFLGIGVVIQICGIYLKPHGFE